MEAFCLTENSRSTGLMLSECMCPICLNILIEPVTLPCKHELCMPCFKRNVEEALFVCPLCRKRISTWARKASKTNKLINEKKWTKIQQAFPLKVQKRLESQEDCCSSDDEFEVVTPCLSEPGEIREEYLKELKKIEDEQDRLRRQEEEASRRLIDQLAQEDERRLREQTHLTEKDEELARQLSQNLNKEVLSSPVTPSSTKPKLSESTASLSSFFDNFLSRTPRTVYLDAVTNQNNAATSSSTSGVNAASACENSPDGFIISRGSSCVGLSGDKLPSLPFMDIKDESCDSDSLGNVVNPLLITSNSSSFQPSLIDTATTSSRSSSTSTNHITNSESSSSVNWMVGESPCITPALPSSQSTSSSSKSTSQRSASPSPSITSEDSITQELVHFKPIHASPKTPPRGGVKKGKDPGLIHTTPRRLSLSTRKRRAPSDDVEDRLNPDLSLCSPIMKKRLQELACERQQQVMDHSKSTSTDGDKVSKENLSPSVSRSLFSADGGCVTPDKNCPVTSSTVCETPPQQVNTTPSTKDTSRPPKSSSLRLIKSTPNSKGKNLKKHPHSVSGKCVKKQRKNNNKKEDDIRSSIKGWLQLQAMGVDSHGKHLGENSFLKRARSAAVFDNKQKDCNQNSVASSRLSTQSCGDLSGCLDDSLGNHGDDDFVLAKRLQEQFDMEHRYKLQALRTREADGEYSFRSRRKSQC